MHNLKNITRQLRQSFSAADGFMTGGHQILKPSRAGVGPRRKNSDWAKSDTRVQKLLLTVFPKLNTNLLQRERAGRWLRVIHLYFRQGMSYGEVAAEMELSKERVKGIIRSVFRALRGCAANRSRKRRKRAVSQL